MRIFFRRSLFFPAYQRKTQKPDVARPCDDMRAEKNSLSDNSYYVNHQKRRTTQMAYKQIFIVLITILQEILTALEAQSPSSKSRSLTLETLMHDIEEM